MKSSPLLITSSFLEISSLRILAEPVGYAAGESQGEHLEPLALLSFLAGITSSAKLLTAVMVLPNRPPILAAKMLTTIDVLSRGRVIVGCGVGWMREEFEVLESPPFEKRGAVCNEYIRAFRELWTQDNPTFEGERLPDGARRSFTGTPAQIADDIKRFAEVGVRHMMFPMIVRRPGVTVQQSLERMARFAAKVMPLI